MSAPWILPETDRFWKIMNTDPEESGIITTRDGRRLHVKAEATQLLGRMLNDEHGEWLTWLRAFLADLDSAVRWERGAEKDERD